MARRGEVCPKCLGLGVTRFDVGINHEHFGKLFDCPACSKGRISEYLRQNSGLTDWLAHVKPDDYMHTDERDPQFQATMELMKQGKGWLTLWGDNGVGKTFLLACALNGFIHDRKEAVYTTAGALLDHLRDSYGDDGPGYSYAFDQWCSCYALAIDEVDSYHRTSWAQDKFRQLLDRRHKLALGGEGVTLFASNVEPGSVIWPPELSYLYSRMSQFPIVQATGDDVRPLMKPETYT